MDAYDFPTKTNEHCINCNRHTLDTMTMTFTGRQYIEKHDDGYVLDIINTGEYKCDKCNELYELNDYTIRNNKKRDELKEVK